MAKAETGDPSSSSSPRCRTHARRTEGNSSCVCVSGSVRVVVHVGWCVYVSDGSVLVRGRVSVLMCECMCVHVCAQGCEGVCSSHVLVCACVTHFGSGKACVLAKCPD
ncbi:unnamed protein product [Gadus morhua 'NCC']